MEAKSSGGVPDFLFERVHECVDFAFFGRLEIQEALLPFDGFGVFAAERVFEFGFFLLIHSSGLRLNDEVLLFVAFFGFRELVFQIADFFGLHANDTCEFLDFLAEIQRFHDGLVDLAVVLAVLIRLLGEQLVALLHFCEFLIASAQMRLDGFEFIRENRDLLDRVLLHLLELSFLLGVIVAREIQFPFECFVRAVGDVALAIGTLRFLHFVVFYLKQLG